MNKCWTMEEIDFIRRSSDLKQKEIAEVLGRTPEAVNTIKVRMGIKKVKSFTKEDEEILIEMMKDGCSFKKISAKLGRNRKSVYNFMYRLRKKEKEVSKGIFYNAYRAWTTEEIEYLISNYHNTSTKVMSEKSGRSPMSISHKAHERKIKKDDVFLKEVLKENYKKWKQSWC